MGTTSFSVNASRARCFIPQVTQQFGAFTLDPSKRELTKHGVPIRLRGHALEILLVLVERRGEIVSRDELKRRLWTADTFVDFEHGLNTAVKKLRAALSDSIENPLFIETVPRAGYRFVAPVETLAEKEPPQPQPQVAASTAPGTQTEVKSVVEVRDANDPATSRRPNLWLITAAVVLALVAGVSALAMFYAGGPTVLVARPLTDTSRIDLYGRLHSDGARIFFNERRGDRWPLMQMAVNGGEAQPFPSPFLNTRVFDVSTDGTELLVAPFSRRDQELPLYVMPSVGGQPRAILEQKVEDAVYSPDGSSITFATPDGIYEVQRDGLNRRLTVAIAGLKQHLRWSPDGKRLRFTLGDPRAEESSIYEYARGSTKAYVLLPRWDVHPHQCCGEWTRDGRYYIFISLTHGGSANVWAVGSGGNPVFPSNRPLLLTQTADSYDDLSLSRDSRHIYTLVYRGRTEYESFVPGKQRGEPLLGGKMGAWIAASRVADVAVFVAPDGGLWASREDGSQAVRLANATLHPKLPRISAEGGEVVFTGLDAATNRARIYLVPAHGGTPEVLAERATTAEAPEWNPDGSTVVFASSDENARIGDAPTWMLYMVNRTTKAVVPIEGSVGFRITRWSPDGKYLAAVSDDDSAISLYEWKTKKWIPAVAKGRVLSAPAWSPDSTTMFYQDVLEPDAPVRQVALDGKLFATYDVCAQKLRGAVMRCGFEGLSRDGRLILQMTRGDHDLVAIDLKPR